MKRYQFLALALAAAAPAVSAAQTGDAPNFILSINGGLTTGGSLWQVNRQLVYAPAGNFDTLSLGRRLSPGLVASVLATLHRSPHFGYVAEVGYFGIGSEARCAIVGPAAPDPEQKNQQACAAAQGAQYRNSVVAFQGGFTWRASATSALTPYVRATGGIGLLGNSYISISSVVAAPTTCGICTWGLLYEKKRATATLVGTLAAGLIWRAGQGYQLRLEVRDIIAGIPFVSDSTGLGSPEPFPTAHTGMRTRHVFAFTAGLDVILERRHRRRY